MALFNRHRNAVRAALLFDELPRGHARRWRGG
jgi:hypothetical protein